VARSIAFKANNFDKFIAKFIKYQYIGQSLFGFSLASIVCQLHIFALLALVG
jgi:hypothetical protein